MAMCPKLGTRGRGVSVGEGVAEAGGGRVAVGGAGVNVDVAEGTGDATLGGAEVMQAVIKMNNKIQKPKRFIQAFLENNFIRALAKASSLSSLMDAACARRHVASAFGVL